MSENDLHKTYLAYIDAINARQFDRLPEFAHEQLAFNDVPLSRDDYAAILRGQIEAVPDFVWHLKAQYAFYHLRDGRFENVWYLLDARTVEAQLRADKN